MSDGDALGFTAVIAGLGLLILSERLDRCFPSLVKWIEKQLARSYPPEPTITEMKKQSWRVGESSGDSVRSDPRVHGHGPLVKPADSYSERTR